MKLIHTLTSTIIIGLSAVASAHCGTCEGDKKEAPAAKKGACACEKGSCSCEKDTCAKGTCPTKSDAPSVSFAVKGMTCGKCSGKVSTALKALEGVSDAKVCHKSGHAVVQFDKTKTSKAKIQAAIDATGFAVTGEKLSMPVSGMTCEKCSGKVTAALKALAGVTNVKVCAKSNHASLTVDTSKTTAAKVIETINATGFKVGEKTATKKASAPATKKS